jgi:protein-tyrosine phosphatase
MDAIRPWLYIGKYRETLNAALLARHNIKAMLLLAELVEHPGITSLYIPVDDGVPLDPKLLRRGLDFVRVEKELNHTVLIACGAGVSRSAAVTIATLKEAEGLQLLDATRIVKRFHPESMPHFALWESLCGYYGEDIPFLTMLKTLEQ